MTHEVFTADFSEPSVEVRSLDPSVPAIVGLDVDPMSTNDPAFDEERLHLLSEDNEDMQALAASIMRTGRVPGLVAIAFREVMNGETKETLPVVLSGRRRVFAARMAVLAGHEDIRVNCFIAEGDATALWREAISENELRVTDEYEAKALRCARAHASGMSIADLAESYGVGEASIANYLAFNDLAPTVKNLVTDGDLPAGTAMQLKDLEPEDQERAAKKLIREGKTQPADARALKAGKDSAPSKRDLLEVLALGADSGMSAAELAIVAALIGEAAPTGALKTALDRAKKAREAKRAKRPSKKKPKAKKAKKSKKTEDELHAATVEDEDDGEGDEG